MPGSRVTVTGGGGFLGRYVVALFKKRGYDVFVPRRVEYDLTHEADVIRLYADAQPDIVVHLAAVVGGIGANRSQPGRFFYENLHMGTMMMEHARVRGVKKFVGDRKSTRLNSSHLGISYAVFCLKKKKQ